MALQGENKKNMTLEKAKQEVLKKVNQGLNYKEICQEGFFINGRIKKFSISEISKIKNESKQELNIHEKDAEKVHLFRLFKMGKTRRDVLIETGFTPDFIRESYQEYLEFAEKTIVPEWFKDYIFNLASKIKPVKNFNDVYNALLEAVDSHSKLQKFTYPCNTCHKPIQFDKDEWADVKWYLIRERWCHEECL